MNDPLKVINDPVLAPEERLDALRSCVREGAVRAGAGGTGEVNNHIHTIYSFSPYTPAMAALKAREAGLEAAGSVDHDSAAAAPELIAACAVLGIGGCSGIELRVSFTEGPAGNFFAARKLNNPDSAGSAYITIQGIPSTALEKTAAFLEPIRTARLGRTKKMTAAANTILADSGFETIDFETDIVRQSQYRKGGEITERHIMAAAADKIIRRYGRGPDLAEGLKKKLNIAVGAKPEKFLSDPANPHYLYDVLGILKTGFLPGFFIQPGPEELIPAGQAVDFALSVNAVPAYSYLGDVGESPTGDKRAEKFEDDFLPELFDEIKRLGFRAVTYMPPRNTPAQLERIRQFCTRGDFMEISGVDINSSRQSFNCPEVLGCPHLVDTTWALIAHERLASVDGNWGIFSFSNPLSLLPLKERIILYAKTGRSFDLFKPEASVPKCIEELNKGRSL
ncbi:MAG: PHP domain-containing protein [Treponema sp.]|jgi:hypothetical protein|nr:PHP domain-containing protein [Treponema sp.]